MDFEMLKGESVTVTLRKGDKTEQKDSGRLMVEIAS